MERERWPDEILRFVDDVVCPGCGAPRSRVLVIVRYQVPVWHVIANCTSCTAMHDWQHIDMAGTMKPKPKQEAEVETPLPAWVREL